MEVVARWIAELTSGDDRRAEAAALALGACGAQALDSLQRLLAVPEPDVRWWAARALSEIEAPEVPALLLQALEDRDQSVRQCAALGLRRSPDVQAVSALAAALAHPDRLFASLAGAALIAIGPPAVPALLETLQHGAPAARIEAARALAQIGDPQAIAGLFAILDETAMLYYWAEHGLEKMGVSMQFFKP